MDRFWRLGYVLAYRVRCHFGLDQILWATGFRGPYLGGCRFPGPEESGGIGVRMGGPWLGGEGIFVLNCPPNGVASFGVALSGLGLRLLDG